MDPCPSELERERFLSGAASDATAAVLAVHRERCPACRAWFERARADDELLGPLREAWRESPASDGPALDELPPEIDTRGLTRYRIGRLIGSGGMGVVYEAEQRSPRRQVALKVVRPGFSSEQLLRRFELEAEVLGRLDHPGIARIHEAGTFGAGADRRPFFAMELVRGVSLLRYVEERELGRDRRLEVFCKICEAVEHAHQKGVIHRDLKPANILVSEAGEPVILDFGVARVTDVEARQETLQTRAGQIVGTLAYMSPEQVAGDAAAVDVRSDVYALGVLYYELLGGARPYELSGLPLTEAVRIVREAEPRPLGALDPALRGDLETIARKALEKAPARRYGSAGQLAADVRRYLNREPIAARPPSAVYQLVRFSQRHRALVGGAAAVLVTLVAGLVASLVLKAQSDRNAELAWRERNNVFSLSAFHELDDLQAEADTLWPILPGRAAELRDWLVRAQELIDGLQPDREADKPGHYVLRDAIRARATALGGEPERFGFRSDEDRWWHEQLEELIAEIEAFADGESGLVDGISPRFGWGVNRRLRWAGEIEERSITGPEVSERWREAIASIADVAECPDYAGLQIVPQLGLVPLGRDPDSGLWEFAHVQSGEPPARDSAGHLVIGGDTALVLVLIPRGTFAMGAQRTDPDAPGYNPNAMDREGPVHEVALSPFLLSKFEMTQGQWLRLAGDEPSTISRADEVMPRPDLNHPVETVSWIECDRTLRRFGLDLPTEAQWEYAARAGTSGSWWAGRDAADLEGAANLADASCRRVSGSVSWVYHDWDDGFPEHAPVGSFRANAFGLHDVLGNVWEWCRDAPQDDFYARSPRLDPFSGHEGTGSRMARGGGWNDPAAAACASIRNSAGGRFRGSSMGVRPSRAISQRQEW